ncbi:MAG TPA: FAD-dependent oxidoreductase [Pseudonocardia sp.]|jgi:monoamine oxidase
MSPARLPIAVVGSGAAGLAAAFRLREAGHHVRLIERNDRLGGKMLTTRREGFTLEEGPVRAEAQDRRIQLAGDYFCTSSLNTASASGERGARNLLGALGQTSPR